MKNLLLIVSAFIIASGCNAPKTDGNNKTEGWSAAIFPASVRLDPTSNKVIENRFKGVKSNRPENENILEKNWIYDGRKVSLHGARGEYVSFQLVLTNHTDSTLQGISIDMLPFKNNNWQLKTKPELFLEWSVNVLTKSTGYPVASLGKGWYPDALIPLSAIQSDSSLVHDRWTYPFWLPDFNNRIEDQKSLIVWVDQFIPFEYEDAKPGVYSTEISVTVANKTQKIPIDLNVWNFAIPNENKLKASLLGDGFLSSKTEKEELELYQLLKRNRISVTDLYQPKLLSKKGEKVKIGWEDFDKQLKKYFTGVAFTAEYGYENGPGYGEPLETFMLPFDVYGKHNSIGWPYIGTPDVERTPANRDIYISAIKEVRDHLQPMINPKKTDITVALSGLDESYFKEALERMVYFGNLFKEYYPEANFMIYGAYDDSAMGFVHNSITAWGSHTLNYDIEKVKKYRQMGIKDWLYGPTLYESKVNSWVGSSSFIDLPLLNDRAISWSCWKYGTYSWLSWGIGVGEKSGWYDPETWKDAYKQGADSDPAFTYKKINGNAQLIYAPGIIPNVTQYCPSIRLKTMRNGVQEYEYMRLLSELDKNKSRTNEIVNSIIKEPFGTKSIGNLDVWSYDAQQWDQGRIKLGELINEALEQRKK